MWRGLLPPPSFATPSTIMSDLLDQALVLLTVIGIDVALSADNAVAIGLAAAPLPMEKRPKVIAIGAIAATILRIGFALIAVQLLHVVGLVLAGGILLLYVAGKLWWELKGQLAAKNHHTPHPGEWDGTAMRQAVISIILADLSMSVENVLAVAGAAREHITIMIIGLALSVLLTGAAANILANLIGKHRWIGFVGVALIIWVSLRMIWDGWLDVANHLGM